MNEQGSVYSSSRVVLWLERADIFPQILKLRSERVETFPQIVKLRPRKQIPFLLKIEIHPSPVDTIPQREAGRATWGGRGARIGAAAAWRVFKSSTAAAQSFLLLLFLLRALGPDSAPETKPAGAASLLRGCGGPRKGKGDRRVNGPRRSRVFAAARGNTLSQPSM